VQVLRPFYLDDTGTAYVYLLSPCGGVVGGDRYNLHLTLRDEARACLTTSAATKLYATSGAVARQTWTITLQPGAVLEYLPEQVIPFAQAAFQQDMTVQLGTGACAFIMEIVAPGRLARGEVFAYRTYSSGLRVQDAQGRLLLRERLQLQPQCWHPNNLGMLEGYTYVGTFYALCEGTPLPSELVEGLHTLLAGQPGCAGSASLLACGGIVVRVLSTAHATLARALYEAWSMLRQHTLGYPAVVWRK
jgi:urease accessory protein